LIFPDKFCRNFHIHFHIEGRPREVTKVIDVILKQTLIRRQVWYFRVNTNYQQKVLIRSIFQQSISRNNNIVANSKGNLKNDQQ